MRRTSIAAALAIPSATLVVTLAASASVTRHSGHGPDRAPAAAFSKSGLVAPFTVKLSAPSAGDVTYAVGQVRIHSDTRLLRAPRVVGQAVFAGRVGGLMIVARSRAWRALRATTRVYVVVSAVHGGSVGTRDVAFFIVRRRAGATRLDRPQGEVTFAVANGATNRSYWVRGRDAHGYANVFHVRNILATAVSNWSRYLTVLRLAGAMGAAAHPAERAGAPTASPAAERRQANQRMWAGGERPSTRVLAMYHLIFNALSDPVSYAAVKKSPLVPDFIEHELGNPTLAARWRGIVADVPLRVPDQYAAAAQEEARFEKVTAPRIARAQVTIADTTNSSAEGLLDQLGFQVPATSTLTIVSDKSTGSGTVLSLPAGIECVVNGDSTSGTCSVDSTRPLAVQLIETPASGSAFTRWSGPVASGCAPTGTCVVSLDSPLLVIGARFTDIATHSLTVTATQAGFGSAGTVTSSPSGIACGTQCSANFPAGSQITLTATPQSAFDIWNNCPNPQGNVCTVTMTQDQSVQATFGYP